MKESVKIVLRYVDIISLKKLRLTEKKNSLWGVVQLTVSKATLVEVTHMRLHFDLKYASIVVMH